MMGPIGISAAISPNCPQELEGEKTTGMDNVFSLLLAAMLGEQPQMPLLPETGGQEGGPEGEMPAAQVSLYPNLAKGEKGGTVEYVPAESPCSLPLAEGEWMAVPQAAAPEGEETELVKLGADSRQELLLLLNSQEGQTPGFATGSNKLALGAEAEEIYIQGMQPRQGENYFKPGGLPAGKGEGEQTKGEVLKARHSSPEFTVSHLITTNLDPKARPVLEAAPSLPEATPLPVTEPDFLERLVARMEMAREQGETQLQIQLKPEVLGKVQIEFVYREGSVSTRLLVENHEVRELLASNLPVLQETLSHQGLKLESVAVGVFVDQQGTGETGSQGNPWSYQQGVQVPQKEVRGSSSEGGLEVIPSLVTEGFDYLV